MQIYIQVMHTRNLCLQVVLWLFCYGIALADYKDDIGYTRLLQEQGASVPDGNGVPVTQAEVSTGEPSAYMPNVADVQFTEKIFTDVTGTNPTGSSSDHATEVGKLFYGTSSSIAPGINTVNIYSAGGWLRDDFLHANNSRLKPNSVPDRIANHSWISDTTDDAADLEVVKRVDWTVENDEFIQIIGLSNDAAVNLPLLSAAFNVIAIGVTDGTNGRSTVSLGGAYVSGRTRPDLVAPFVNTSSSTPVIAAAAALLVDFGHATASLSTDPVETSTSTRDGNIIFNAERSEVVKAVLMAGADRVTNNTTNPDPDTPKDITDYRIDPANQSANGLDVRFGAGQVNIYNSFQILSAGEQNSIEDTNTVGTSIGTHGFDYDPSFGGAGGGSNVTGSYTFSTGDVPVMMTVALVWNIEVSDDSTSSFPGIATLYDLDLHLYDATGGSRVLLVESVSTIDNTENLWVRLDAGKDYLLEVTPKEGQSPFQWDYALAWQSVVLDADPLDLSGTIKTAEGQDICAIVLASSQFMFSCNPPGVFSLTDLARDNDGTVKRQIYADGFSPKIDILRESTSESVVMVRAGTCPSYNSPYDPMLVPASAGKHINIAGQVMLQNSQTPICAIVLANGQYLFSCDGSGSYALNIPLDANGQFKLQVYADGFAPTIQTFDEFQTINDVRLARSSECSF